MFLVFESFFFSFKQRTVAYSFLPCWHATVRSLLDYLQSQLSCFDG